LSAHYGWVDRKNVVVKQRPDEWPLFSYMEYDRIRLMIQPQIFL